MRPQGRLRLGELLVEARIISADQLEQILVLQRADGRRLGTLLVERGLIGETQLTQILSQQLSVPWVSLHHIDFSRKLLGLIPRDTCERFCLVPIYVRSVRGQGDVLYVAMDDPMNDEALTACAQSAGLPARPMIAAPSDIRAAIRIYYAAASLPPARQAPVPSVPSVVLAPEIEADSVLQVPPMPVQPAAMPVQPAAMPVQPAVMPGQPAVMPGQLAVPPVPPPPPSQVPTPPPSVVASPAPPPAYPVPIQVIQPVAGPTASPAPPSSAVVSPAPPPAYPVPIQVIQPVHLQGGSAPSSVVPVVPVAPQPLAEPAMAAEPDVEDTWQSPTEDDTRKSPTAEPAVISSPPAPQVIAQPASRPIIVYPIGGTPSPPLAVEAAAAPPAPAGALPPTPPARDLPPVHDDEPVVELREVAIPARTKKGRTMSLTMLDGTTIAMPVMPRRRGLGTPVAPPVESDPPSGEGGEDLSLTELLAALRGLSHGAEPAEDMQAYVRWERLIAALLTLLVRKRLIMPRELIEELKKI